MRSIDTEDLPSEQGPSALNLSASTRIDPAHALLGRGDEAAANLEIESSPVDAQVAELSPDLTQQLRQQAEQLGEHLQARQKELDHREGQLNVRAAELDRQASSARLWLTERHGELAERAEDLNEQQQVVARRMEELNSYLAGKEASRYATDLHLWEREAELSRKLVALNDRETELAASSARAAEKVAANEQAAANLESGWARLARERGETLRCVRQFLAGFATERRARSGKHQDAEEGLNELQNAVAELQARQQCLDEAEAAYMAAQADLDQQRRELTEQRQIYEDRTRAERHEFSEKQRQSAIELDKKRQTLKARAESLDVREAAIDQMRGDLARMHREALEMRLATEEVWLQLAGSAPPAALTQSLGKAREQLADYYRLANAELADQKQRIEALASRVAGQHEQLAEQKRDLQTWAAHRQQEIELQAAKLATRAQELEKQEAHFRGLDARWHEERNQFQRRIRLLKTESRGSGAAAHR